MSFEGHENAMASCKFEWETVPEGSTFFALKAPEPAKGALFPHGIASG
jgi:hypothetical protein